MGNDPVGIVAACSMGRVCVCTAGIHQPAKCLAFSATSLGTRLWQATCVQPSTSLPSSDMTVLQSVTCFLNHTCCCCCCSNVKRSDALTHGDHCCKWDWVLFHTHSNCRLSLVFVGEKRTGCIATVEPKRFVVQALQI